jgi:microsomal dipeptidase-like Zn-dependent dipeptidase
MTYFDFHAHIILKQLFEDSPNIDTLIYSSDVSLLPAICSDLPYIIESQIHQSQLASFRDQVIVGAVLYGLESELAAAVIPLQTYLKPDSRQKLSVALLQAVAAAGYQTFDAFVVGRTLNLYLQAAATFNVLTKDNVGSALPTNKVNVFFSVEGCHSLVNSINRATATTGYDPAEVLSNLDTLLGKVRVFTVNLTHLQQSNLCNHAFGMQLASPAPFYPTGNGLTDAGRAVVQGLFKRWVGIDLKHMSCKTRQDLRAEVQAGKYQNPLPPMCTHAGFTGVGLQDWPGYISLKKPVAPGVLYLEVAKTIQVQNNPDSPAPGFNMATINLFNEDIVWIVQSGGMIGLSMDRRILGFVSRFDDQPTGLNPDATLVVDKEYFSTAEWVALGIADGQLGKAITEEGCVQLSAVEAGSEGDIPTRDKYFYDHVLLHIKHYFQVCVDAGITVAEAQQHLGIGSDFDGLINPFINFDTCLDMPALKSYIAAQLGNYLRSLSDSKKWADQLNVAAFVEGLFYNNGYNFVKAFFANSTDPS